MISGSHYEMRIFLALAYVKFAFKAFFVCKVLNFLNCINWMALTNISKKSSLHISSI